MENSAYNYPAVGLLFNPAVPFILDEVGDLVQHIAVIPERYWHEIDPKADVSARFHNLYQETETIKFYTQGRVTAGHGIGLSLPSPVPLDTVLLERLAAFSEELGFSWYSEHLSSFLLPDGDIPNLQAGMGLPVVYDEEVFQLVKDKLFVMQEKLKCQVLLENGSIFTSIPEMDMTETEFLNRLHRETGSGILLDLHNLYVTAWHGNAGPEEYLEEIDPDAVVEVHLAGGEELAGYYIDSHSKFTPEDIWSWAFEFLPRYKNLRAITFEFQETYFEQLGIAGITKELERMHELARSCRPVSQLAEVAYA